MNQLPLLKTHQNRKFVWLPEVLTPAVVIALCIFSVLTIGACMSKPLVGNESWVDYVRIFWRANYVKSQIFWCAGGLVLMFVVGLLPYHYYQKYAVLLYWINIGLLVAVMLLGTERNGAKRWIEYNGQTIQPSELAKIAMILFLSKRISACQGKINTWRQLIPIVFYFAIPFTLILLQPDFGTAMIFLVIFVALLFAGGLDWRFLVGALGSTAVLAPVTWLFVLRPYQKERILNFLDPSLDDQARFQITKALNALGSGGIWGKGIFDTGSMGQLNLLPEKQTDFVFCMVAEAFGLVGVLALILLYGVLLTRLLSLALQCRDRYGSLVLVGLIAMLTAHIFENIGMNMAIMPITGIPLPFISYGGTAMVTNMLAMGIALSVARYRPEAPKERLGGDHRLLRINPWAKIRRLPTVEK